jgi:hypothetical protein
VIYDYICPICRKIEERMVSSIDRDAQAHCGTKMFRMLSAPHFKFKGVVTKGGGPDKFTADMLGIPLHDLPDGLRTK